MKRFFGFALMAAIIAVPAFAGNKPATVVIPEKVAVGTTQVPAGTYKLSYTGSGASVQVTLTQGKKTVATFPAKEVTGKSNPGVETYSHAGVVTLESIDLGKVSLVVEGAPQPGQ